MKKLIVYIMVVFGITSCIEPFDTTIPGGNNLVVIDGAITDEEGPYTVKLTRSSLLTENNFPAITGALVAIEEQNGPSEILTEVEPGIYQTSPTGLRGEAGKTYRLRVMISDDQTYESDWVTMKASPPVENLYSQFEEQLVNLVPKQGYQIYVDSRDPNGNTIYYRYEWIETWKYRVPFFPIWVLTDICEYRFIDPNDFCFKEATSTDISLANSLSNAEDVVSRHPLLYVTTDPDRLRIRYSIQVKQHAINEEEYIFWEGLQETSGESGSLFDVQPRNIRSNLRNVSRPDELVLGYFSVSGVSDERIYIDANDHPEGVVVEDLLTPFCLDQFDTIFYSETALLEVQAAVRDGLLFYDFLGIECPPNAYTLVTPFCGDCTVHGGTNEVPDFWIE